jgi:hypothetical protein
MSQHRCGACLPYTRTAKAGAAFVAATSAGNLPKD